MPAISSKISHVAGFRLATLASTQPHAVVNTNLQNKVYTTLGGIGVGLVVLVQRELDKSTFLLRDFCFPL